MPSHANFLFDETQSTVLVLLAVSCSPCGERINVAMFVGQTF